MRALLVRTGFEGEGGDVDDDFWTGLEDDEEHADGARDAVEVEVVVQRAGVRDGSGRVGERGDVRDALQHRVPFVARAKVEALHERGGETPGCGFCFRMLFGRGQLIYLFCLASGKGGYENCKTHRHVLAVGL